MLSDRFGAFKAIASSSIPLARAVPDEERAMDILMAEAILSSEMICAPDQRRWMD